jgi:hypothetical protein
MRWEAKRYADLRARVDNHASLIMRKRCRRFALPTQPKTPPVDQQRRHRNFPRPVPVYRPAGDEQPAAVLPRPGKLSGKLFDTDFTNWHRLNSDSCESVKFVSVPFPVFGVFGGASLRGKLNLIWRSSFRASMSGRERKGRRQVPGAVGSGGRFPRRAECDGGAGRTPGKLATARRPRATRSGRLQVPPPVDGAGPVPP